MYSLSTELKHLFRQGVEERSPLTRFGSNGTLVRQVECKIVSLCAPVAEQIGRGETGFVVPRRYVAGRCL